MSLVKNFVLLSHYNQRINQQLINCCLKMPNDLLHKDTKSFFPTILSYWNHILFGDLILLGRIAANNITHLKASDLATFPSPQSPTDIYCHEFTEIVILREAIDKLLIKFCQQLTENQCQQSISYTSTEGEHLTIALADLVQHIFNHQSHHRGQLTCLLSQCGVDYGCMDLPVIVAEGSGR